MKNLFFLFIAIIIVIPLLVFAYLGFVPGLSKLLDSDKPTDLGISYSQQDYKDADKLTKIDRQFLPTNSPNEFEFSDKSHRVSKTLTSSQVTAWINQRTWKHYPFSNLQIKFGQNESAQVSGNVDIKKLVKYFQVLGGLYTDKTTQIDSHIPFSGTPAFYLDLVGKVEDNQIDLKFKQVKIGKLKIPRVFVSSYTPRLIEFIQENTFYTHQ